MGKYKIEFSSEARKDLKGNYLIFYKVIDEEKIIQIVRIMYKRRNWINLL